MADTRSERITVACECGAKLGLRASFAGHKAKCPKCGRSFVVPSADGPAEAPAPAYSSPEKPTEESRPATASQGTVKVGCPSCGKHIRVPANATGRKARCPACEGVFVIGQIPASPAVAIQPKPVSQPAARSAPKPAPASQPPLPEADQEQDDGTYGWSDGGGSLLAEAEQQPAADAGTAYKLCPNCGQTMPAEARLCVACGFDTKTGRRMQDTAVSGGGGGALSAVGGVLGSAVRSSGALLLGTLLSFLGAMLGAAIWAGIAYAVHLEIGWIAWAIGGLAGGGMYLGYRNQSTLAGLIASFMAVLGIVVGKIGVFVIVVLSMLATMATTTDNAAPGGAAIKSRDNESNMMERYALASHHAELKANRQGLSYDDPKRNAIYTQEEQRFKAMPPDQIKKAADEMEKWEQGGKWKDAAYVRDFLIYSYIDKALEAEADKKGVETDEREVTPVQWQQHHRDAVKRADGIAADQRLAEAKRIEAEQKAAMDKATAEMEEEVGDAAGQAAVGLLGLFFSALFGWMDILFLILAVATAYHLASGLSFGG